MSQKQISKLPETPTEEKDLVGIVSHDLLSSALRAICLTRDYVGEGLLPAVAGWEWFDVGTSIAAAIPDDEWAKQFHARVSMCRTRSKDNANVDAPAHE